MQRFEYHVVPAPRRGEKARGAKTTEERFSVAMTNLMNELGLDGWEYVRADALPCEERVGLTGSKTTFQNVLVFKRALVVHLEEVPPARTVQPPAPVATTPVPSPLVLPASGPKVGAAEAPFGAAPSVRTVTPGKSGQAAE